MIRYTNPGVGFYDGRYLKLDASNDPVTGAIQFQNAANSVTAFQILDSDGGVPIFNVDTVNERVGIGTATPSAQLHFVSNVGAGLALFENNNNMEVQIKSTTSGDRTSLILTTTAGDWYIRTQENVNSGALIFNTAAGSTAGLNINRDNKVGIGDIATTRAFEIFSTAGAGTAIMRMIDIVETVHMEMGAIPNDGGQGYQGTVTNHPFSLVTNGVGFMYFDTFGRVGIKTGLAGHGARFHVKGTIDEIQTIIQAHATQTANIVEIQDSSNNVLLNITGGGDLEFEAATSGLIFGAMFIPGTDIVVVIGDANPTEVENAGEDGWSAGELNGVTFPTGGTEHYLTVPKAGKYEITWNMSFHNDAGVDEVHGGVMIDDAAIRDNGEAHRSVKNANDSGDIGASCIADLTSGDEEISLWILSTGSNNVHVEHATVTIKQIGGT